MLADKQKKKKEEFNCQTRNQVIWRQRYNYSLSTKENLQVDSSAVK